MKKFNLFILALLAGVIAQAQSLTTAAIVIANVSCHGGDNGVTNSISTGGTTPYTYLWSPGGQTTQTATGLVAATYTVRVTDHVGNTATSTATVNQPTAPLSITAWAKYPSVCPLSSDSLFSSGSGGSAPYSYTWQGPIADISCPSCENTSVYPDGGVYLITAVNDAAGCTATSSVAITVYPVSLVSITGPLSPVSYTSDTLTAIAPGASSYLWSNSATTSTIIVSPAGTTTYSVKTTNSFGCYDTNHYTVSANTGNGNSSGTAIPVSPSTNVGTTSYSSLDSVVWFSFVAADSNNQIIAYSNWLSEPVPHVHRLTLYNNSMQTIMDENMPDIVGANQIRLDISHLNIGSTYYVRAARCPAHANMTGCNPSAAGECNPSMRWDFQMCFRTVPVFVPDDSGNEAPSISQLYYEDRGQISDWNDIPRFDIKAYTNIAYPAVYVSDSAVSFAFGDADSVQRVDMKLTGAYVQPSQPVFKTQEDSNVGYLNYFKEYTENGVGKIEGYSRLVYKNVYPNTDVEIYSNSAGTKLYFIANPGIGGGSGGNPADIELKFSGASSVNVTGGGGLNVHTLYGTLSFAPGYAYTDSAGIIKPKSWQPYFIAVNSNTVRFNTGSFNTNEPLIIRIDRGHRVTQTYSSNGNLDWSTDYGGTGITDHGLFKAVAHDDSNNVYVVGYTNSAHFPVTANLSIISKQYKGDTDAVVGKFKANVYSREWVTYYGGSGNDQGNGIAVDGAGKNVYITGSTNSTDFFVPRANGGYYQQLNGNGSGPNTDAFIADIFDNGFDLDATYYGGPGNESGHAITLDNLGNVYIVGDGDSNTPHLAKTGAYNDSTGTGLIAEFTAPGLAREWATLIGDSVPDGTGFNGCAVDNSNDFFVTGASGPGCPVSGSYALPFDGGGYDIIVIKFNPSGSINWSTYEGGDGLDVGNAIATDEHGNAFITGHTFSPDPYQWLVSQIEYNGWSYYQGINGNGPGNGNAFIAKLGSDAIRMWGTFFGGDADVDGAGITTDIFGNVYVTGDAYSTNGMVFPGNQAAGAYVQNSPPANTRETFIAAFNYWDDYYWGTYLCDSSNRSNCSSVGYGITTYDQKLFVVGTTQSGTFEFISPGGGAWFEGSNLSNVASSPYISEFNLAMIPTGIHTLATNEGALEIYPNPTNNNVTAKMNVEQAGNVQFTLYNLLGEPVYSEMTNEPVGLLSKQISLSSLPNGNYILQVNQGNSVYHTKITKLQ